MDRYHLPPLVPLQVPPQPQPQPNNTRLSALVDAHVRLQVARLQHNFISRFLSTIIGLTATLLALIMHPLVAHPSSSQPATESGAVTIRGRASALLLGIKLGALIAAFAASAGGMALAAAGVRLKAKLVLQQAAAPSDGQVPATRDTGTWLGESGVFWKSLAPGVVVAGVLFGGAVAYAIEL
ncbi:hypothetical protein BCR44DRAFT_1443051 [Catenaria anguillulae PL171]|uniref:Uncharacterized protein n=1 Tax=Catenaria anguillulae PL171 TaxID=765915 RepID=A0A1Y2H976_9FUNG|nr:hypothetical protein BCR44DRAFT_1443051 [Catenaria anguillulae PL171]